MDDRVVRVLNFPAEKKLLLLLMLEDRQKNGGKVEIYDGDGFVDVEFEWNYEAQDLLSVGEIDVGGETFEVIPACDLTSLQVTGLKSDILKIHLTLFLENKTNCNNIKILSFESEEGYATCSLTCSDEALRILEKEPHKIDQCEIRLLRIPNDLANFKELSCGIKVMMSSMLSEKSLKILFKKCENAIEELYIDKNNKTAVFTYKTPKDACLHLNIRNYESISFQVERMVPIFVPSIGDCDKFLDEKFIVSNLPLMFDDERLVNYFDQNLRSPATAKVLYARSNPGSALVIFNSSKDFFSLQRIVYSKPFCDIMLRLELVERPRSVYISGIDDISPEQFTRSFESWGYQVEKAFFGDNFAILTFNSFKFIDEVASAGCVEINGRRLNVSIHYEKLGIEHSEDANMGSKCWLQKCTFFECKSYIVNYLLENDEARSWIDRNLEKNFAVIDWPRRRYKTDESVEMRVRLVVGSPLFHLEKLKTWDEDCLQAVKGLMVNFIFFEANLPKEMRSSILGSFAKRMACPQVAIQEGEMTMCGEVLLHLDGDRLVGSGLNSKVQFFKDLMNVLYTEERRRFERESLKVSCDVNLKGVKGNFLQKEKNLFDSLKVDTKFNDSTTVVTLRGLPDDLNAAKLKITEFLSKTISKIFNCEEFVGELLKRREVVQHVDEILSKKGLSSAFSMEEAKKLYICTPNDSQANEAFKVIKSELIETSVQLDESTRETLKDSQLQGRLMAYNQNPKLMIKIDNDGGGAMSVCGVRGDVEGAVEWINLYFDSHAVYSRVVETPRGRFDLFEKHLTDDFHKLLRETSVTGRCLQDGCCIQLEGTRSRVDIAIGKVEGLLRSVETFRRIITKPEFMRYLESERGRMALSSVGLRTRTHVEISDDDGGCGLDVDASGKFASVSLGDDVTLDVVLGNILSSGADAIVNAANGRLAHVGGVAAAISKAAGPEFQRECSERVRKGGCLEVGDVYFSSAGQLKFKAIVNVVGPMYGREASAELKLYEVVQNVLLVLEQREWKRVALPAISAGVFGFPIDLATKITLKCIKDHARNLNHLKAIEIVDINPEVIKEYQKNVKEMFSEKEILFYKEMPSSRKRGASTLNQQTSNPKVNRIEKKTSRIGSSLPPLKFVKGSLVNQGVDAIVNSASLDLDLRNGVIASLISQSAGPQIQQACSDYIKKNGNLRYGDVFVSNGFSLPCKFVFHGVCASWSSPEAAEMSIRLLIRNSLKEANRRKLKSIALPSLGTGKLNVPGGLVIKWMYEETDGFFGRYPDSSLVDLRLVVYEKDLKVIKAFEEFTNPDGNARQDEVERRLVKTPVNKLKNEKGFIVQILKFNVELCLGDLTEEKTDAIVNGTDSDCDLSKGAIAQAIIEKGGLAIQDECKKLGKLNVIHVTSAGNLACKHIFHVNLEKELAVVEACLSKAEELKLSSISFPLLMTGLLQKGIAGVAQSMFEKLEKFAKEESPQWLNSIRVVVNDEDKLKEVQESLKEPDGTFRKLFKTYIKSEKSYSLKEYCSPKSLSTLCIYAFSENDANEAELLLKESMSDVYKECVIGDTWSKIISDLDEDEIFNIMDYENKENVHIDIDKSKGKITIAGVTPGTAHMEVVNLLQEIKAEKEEAETISKKVQWYYKEKDYKQYSAEINLIIEKAFRNKKELVTWKEVQGSVEIDFVAMTECCTWAALIKHSIKRVTQEDIFPLHWDNTLEKVKLFDIIPGSKEYSKVEQDVLQTSGKTVTSIEKITRIQNVSLFKQYAIKRDSLAGDLRRMMIAAPAEETLWHVATLGTDDKIRSHGFNRVTDVRPQKAAALGQASYFFKSFCDIYQSSPDQDGLRRAYRCLVLTGRYTAGSPNSKDTPSDFVGKYDSSVDDSINPTTFAIFNDCQAYPEYLICYK